MRPNERLDKTYGHWQAGLLHSCLVLVKLLGMTRDSSLPCYGGGQRQLVDFIEAKDLHEPFMVCTHHMKDDGHRCVAATLQRVKE